MTITSIRISNFESHEKTSLELHPGVNVLIGLPDSGKSSLLRAARWLLFNDQQGDNFRRHGSKITEVSVTIDGKDIKRGRSNQVNFYSMDGKQPDDPLVFDKVSKDVPDEVADLLNLDDINVQKQFDAPFLLSENSAEVARVLNRAAGMEDIDATMSRVNSIELENGRELKIRTADLGTVEDELLRFAKLDELDGSVAATEASEVKLHSLWNTATAIESELRTLEETDDRLAGVRPVAELNVSVAEGLLVELEKAQRKEFAMGRGLHDLEFITTKEKELREVMAHSDALRKADSVVLKHKEAAATHNAVRKLLTDLDGCDEEMEDLGQKLDNWRWEFDELMPEECPLCGRNCSCVD